ncbi:ribonuclease H-like domain-containing protein [Lentinula edodes]|uniref:RNA exonuclease 4 n=1 Tax=Lentinula lateritia TaxID=40482 RepID=A0A9W9DTT8_9AGAR|nr:ribonuclease H-like domain-containing protein [Lentinula edodes]
MAHTKQYYAISCINVGVGPGGTTSMLARIAIVDFRGNTILDTYVSPTMKITEYRTATTGIEPAHLSSRNAASFNTVQQYVANIIKGHILVGHSIWNDLSVLGIPHPAVDTRDVALYQPFRNALRSPNHIVGLQTLSWQLMCRRCQESEQNPLENARAALDLYRSDATDWEEAIRRGSWPCALPPSTFSRCYL